MSCKDTGSSVAVGQTRKTAAVSFAERTSRLLLKSDTGAAGSMHGGKRVLMRFCASKPPGNKLSRPTKHPPAATTTTTTTASSEQQQQEQAQQPSTTTSSTTTTTATTTTTTTNNNNEQQPTSTNAASNTMSGMGQRGGVGFRQHAGSESSCCSTTASEIPLCPENQPTPASALRGPPEQRRQQQQQQQQQSPDHPARAVTAAAGSGPHPTEKVPTHFCESAYLLPTRLATIGLALVQGGILDCYLTRYNSTYWFAWIAGDVAVFMMFVVAFVISYRQMSQVMKRLQRGAAAAASPHQPLASPRRDLPSSAAGRGSCCVGGLALLGMEPVGEKDLGDGDGLVTSAGSMPLAYFAWLVYSAVLAVRVLLIYNNFAHELSEDVFLGKNMLQMTVAASSLVFLLLLFAHHDAAPDSRRRHRIDVLTYLVIFDIVDAVDLVSVLANPEARDAVETWVKWSVLGVSCLNLVMPTLPLMALSRTQFGARPLPEYLQTLHRLMVLLGVNVPLLATRLFLWHHVRLAVSTFLVKNVAVSFLMLYGFYERDHHKRLRDMLTQSSGPLA